MFFLYFILVDYNDFPLVLRVLIDRRSMSMVLLFNYSINCSRYHSKSLRKVVKTTILEQDPPNNKIVGGVCLHPPCLTSKDGVFIA